MIQNGFVYIVDNYIIGRLLEVIRYKDGLSFVQTFILVVS